MVKYIAIVDYKAATGKGFGFHDLNAETIPDAMSEAEQYKNETAYLVHIAEKRGNVQRHEGARRSIFREILTTRGNGWHNCDAEHCEHPAEWERADYGAFVDFQLV